MQITLGIGFVVTKDKNIADYVLEDRRMEAKTKERLEACWLISLSRLKALTYTQNINCFSLTLLCVSVQLNLINSDLID